MKTFKCLGDRVLIEQMDRPEMVTASGIVINVEKNRQEPEQGIVMAIGEGKTNEDGKVIPITSVKVGDIVLFPQYSGTRLTLNSESYLLMSIDDLQGILL